MFSFLPLSYKEKVKKEYTLRVWASVCLAIGCVALVSAVLVFPAYLSAKSVESLAATRYAIAQKDLESLGTDQDISVSLAKTKSYMMALQTLSSLDADTIANTITAAKPEGVTVTSISIGTVGGGVSVSVGGNAQTRNGLIAFSHALSSAVGFSNVVLPVNDLAQDTDIAYTISLSINKQTQ